MHKLLIVLMICLGGAAIMPAQDSSADGKAQTPEEIEKEIDLIKAQTDLKKAKADDIAAQRALEKAQQQPDTKLDCITRSPVISLARLTAAKYSLAFEPFGHCFLRGC